MRHTQAHSTVDRDPGSTRCTHRSGSRSEYSWGMTPPCSARGSRSDSPCSLALTPFYTTQAAKTAQFVALVNARPQHNARRHKHHTRTHRATTQPAPRACTTQGGAALRQQRHPGVAERTASCICLLTAPAYWDIVIPGSLGRWAAEPWNFRFMGRSPKPTATMSFATRSTGATTHSSNDKCHEGKP